MNVKKIMYACPACLDMLARTSTTIACLWIKFCYDCSPGGEPFSIINPSRECEDNLQYLEENKFLTTCEINSRDIGVHLSQDGDEFCCGFCYADDDLFIE